MTLLSNGDFDQTLELTESLLTDIARATISVNPGPLDPIRSDQFHANIAADIAIRHLWFRERPAGWANQSKFGRLIRNTSSLVTLAIEITLHIDVIGFFIPQDDGPPTFQDLSAEPLPIDLRTYVEITDYIEDKTLAVRLDRESSEEASVPCVVIDFNESLGSPDNWPLIDVRVSENDFRAAPIIMAWLLSIAIEAQKKGLDITEETDKAVKFQLDAISAQLKAVIRPTVQNLTDWRIKEKGIVLLFTDVSAFKDKTSDPPPLTLKQAKARTFSESLFIGLDYLAKRGNISNANMSTLGVVDGARLAAFTVKISNRMLLRGMIRRALIKTFGLDTKGKDFIPGEYCVLARATSATLAGKSITLNSLIAFVDSNSQLRILIDLKTEAAAGATAFATIDMHLTFSVKRALVGHNQVLSIVSTLANPTTAVTSQRVDLAWYWYLVAGLTGGLAIGPIGAVAGLIVAGILDGIVMENEAKESLQTGVGATSVPSTDTPVSLPLTLTFPELTLHDEEAELMPTPFGNGFLFTFFQARAHDLTISAVYSRLPNPLSVTFQIPDSTDPGNRLDGIGGILPDGAEWALPIDAAISLVDGGYTLRAVPSDPAQPNALIMKVINRNGIPYLRTMADDFGENNLGNLPIRIPAVSTALGPAG